MSEGFFYVGSPYSRYIDGREAAYREACRVTTAIARAGVKCFSPVVHWHAAQAHGTRLERDDPEFWLEMNMPFMLPATGLIVVKMHGWQESEGLTGEIDFFTNERKPLLFIDPGLTVLGGITPELRRAA